MCKCLEFGVMSGHKSRTSRFKKLIEDRARQGRTFLRIRACTEFIEDDKRTLVDLFEDPDDVRDVTTERAERLLDGLLIADICIDRLETGQLRATICWNVEAALCHEREQTNRFE